MASLKRFIVEIHRRSLWQVLTIYLGASWAVLEVTDQIIARYLLPEWVYPAALILLLIGLPIVLGTAFVREERREAESVPTAEVRDPTLLGEISIEAAVERETPRAKPIVRLLTWPRAILGGLLAFAVLGVVSASIVLRGEARVTEARGAAGDAFEERAWIVMADWAAPESDADVALAAQTALEVDLQQSQYVNLKGRNQIKPVLRRMGLSDDSAFDEDLALEVAEREGLSAVLAPAVARLGDDYVFSARVVQPGTGEELISVRAVAREDRLIEAVEKLSHQLRERLGEAGEAIRNSRPLPEVTTRSLEALKVYARAVEASLRTDDLRTLEFAQEAIRLDSTFAMAHRLLGVVYQSLARFSEAEASARRAYELRDRLTERERLHVEAVYYLDAAFDPRRAAEVYELLLSRYPDDSRAANNLGVTNSTWLANYERAYEAYQKTLELDPYGPIGYTNAISEAIQLEKWEAVDSLIATAKTRGVELRPTQSVILLAVAVEDWQRADLLCDSLLAATSSPGELVGVQTYCGGLAASRGRAKDALALLEHTGRFYAERGRVIDHAFLLSGLANIEQLRGRPAAARSYLVSILEHYPGDSISEIDRVVLRSRLSVAAGTLGYTDLIDRAEAAYPRDLDPDYWWVDFELGLQDGARALSVGEPARTVRRVHEVLEFGYEPYGSMYDVHLLLGIAFGELGEPDSAISHFEKAFHPARFSEGGTWSLRGARSELPFAIRRLAELEESRGNTEAAIRQYQRLLELWSDADPELSDQVASAQRALARLTGRETS